MMLGYSDIETRNLDLKMRMLGTRSMVREAVSSRKQEGVDIERLRLGLRTWNYVREDYAATETLFGYPVEIVEGDHDLIDVVSTADVRTLLTV